MEVAENRTVRLAVPPDPDYLVLARLALGAVCRLTALRLDEVLDLKLAVTEAAVGVLDEGDEPKPASERIDFSFQLGPDRLVLEVAGSLPSDLTPEERRLGRAIVEATVDSCQDLGHAIRLERRLDGSEERT